MIHDKKIVKRRKLIAGRGIMDTILKYSRHGLHEVRKHVVHGVKHYIKTGSHHMLNHLADRGHEIIKYVPHQLAEHGHNLIHHTQHAAQEKIDQLVGHGIKPRQHNNRSVILREIQQSIGGNGISKRKHRMV